MIEDNKKDKDDFDNDILKSRFSAAESISHYTPFCLLIKTGGIIWIGGDCRCYDKKKCNCLEKITNYIREIELKSK
jgi:hypothetical protein